MLDFKMREKDEMLWSEEKKGDIIGVNVSRLNQ